MKDASVSARRREIALGVGSYWILALPGFVKTLGGYALAREFGNEIVDSIYHWQVFIHRWFGDGIPFWNPFVHGGLPVIGHPEVGALHPVSALHFFMGPEGVVNTVLWAGPAVAASLMFVFALQLTRLTFGAWLAGLVYGFHAYWGGRVYVAGEWNVALSYPFVPLVLAGALGALRRDGGLWIALLGGGTAVLLLASYIPLWVLVAASVIVTALFARGGGRSRIRSVARLSAGLGLGVIVALPHFLPLIHFWRQTANPIPLESARDYPFDRLLAEHLVSVFFPRFFGDEVNSTYWGRLSYSPVALYSGIATWVLAVLALLYVRRRATVLSFLGLAISAVLAAELLPIYGQLASCPGWVQASKSPASLLGLWPLCVAVLAALGWEGLVSMPVPQRRRAGYVVLLLVFVSAVVGWIYFGRTGSQGMVWRNLVNRITDDPSNLLAPEVAERIRSDARLLEGSFRVAYDSVVRSLAYLGGFGLLLAFGFASSARPRAAGLALTGCLFSADVAGFFHAQESIYPFELLRLPRAIAEHIRAQCGQDYRVLAPSNPDLCWQPVDVEVASAWVRTPFVYKDFHDVVRLIERQPTFYAPGLMLSRYGPFVRSMGVRHLLTRPNSVYKDPACTVTLQTPTVWSYDTTATVLRRAYFPRRIEVTTESARALFQVVSQEWAPEEVGFVEVSDKDVGRHWVQPADTTTSIVRVDGRGMTIALARPTTAPCVLMLSDIYDPWWKARSEGAEIPMHKGNYVFRALELPAGAQRIELQYEVPYWEVTRVLAWLGGLVLLALGLWRGQQKPAGQTRRASGPGSDEAGEKDG